MPVFEALLPASHELRSGSVPLPGIWDSHRFYRSGIVRDDQNAGCASCRVEAHASGSGCDLGASPCLHQRLQPLLQRGPRDVLGQARRHRPRLERCQENAES